MTKICIGIIIIATLFVPTSLSQTGPTTSVVAAKDSPLKISNIGISNSNNKSVITYSVENISDKVINGYVIMTKIYDANGVARAGEKHTVKDALSPGQRLDTAFIFHSGLVAAGKNYVIGSSDEVKISVYQASRSQNLR